MSTWKIQYQYTQSIVLLTESAKSCINPKDQRKLDFTYPICGYSILLSEHNEWVHGFDMCLGVMDMTRHATTTTTKKPTCFLDVKNVSQKKKKQGNKILVQ